jgi:hypothetical protein
MEFIEWMRLLFVVRFAARRSNMIGPDCRSHEDPFGISRIGMTFLDQQLFVVRMTAKNRDGRIALRFRELIPGDSGDSQMPDVVPRMQLASPGNDKRDSSRKE